MPVHTTSLINSNKKDAGESAFKMMIIYGTDGIELQSQALEVLNFEANSIVTHIAGNVNSNGKLSAFIPLPYNLRDHCKPEST
jgi:hypothetical protein